MNDTLFDLVTTCAQNLFSNMFDSLEDLGCFEQEQLF